jgi:hypothetical protein
MSCCGKKRAQARRTPQTQRGPTPTEKSASQPRPERDSTPYFQYIGNTGLTVMGPRTRKRYRFDSPGAVVAADPRDQRALSAVSILRLVRKPTNVT